MVVSPRSFAARKPLAAAAIFLGSTAAGEFARRMPSGSDGPSPAFRRGSASRRGSSRGRDGVGTPFRPSRGSANGFGGSEAEIAGGVRIGRDPLEEIVEVERQEGAPMRLGADHKREIGLEL